MKINGSQLFFREIGGEFSKNNAFLVCGLIRLDNSEQIKDGSLLTLSECEPCIYHCEDRKDYTKGMALDQIMRSPIWRLK